MCSCICMFSHVVSTTLKFAHDASQVNAAAPSRPNDHGGDDQAAPRSTGHGFRTRGPGRVVRRGEKGQAKFPNLGGNYMSVVVSKCDNICLVVRSCGYYF
jgi:hypothetical protein